MKNKKPYIENYMRRTDGLTLPHRLWEEECTCRKPKLANTIIDVQQITEQKGPRTVTTLRKKRACWMCYGYRWENV